MAEEEVRKLERRFKEGSLVRVRILGFRHLEGLATGILKVAFILYNNTNAHTRARAHTHRVSFNDMRVYVTRSSFCFPTVILSNRPVLSKGLCSPTLMSSQGWW